MKRWWRPLSVSIVSFLIVYYAFELLGFVPRVAELCIKAAEQQNPDCVKYDVISYIILRVVRIADTHNGLITAFATIIIGFFTYTLWKLNFGLERPFIYVHRTKMTAEGRRKPGEPNSWMIKIELKNFGRTIAIIEELQFGIVEKNLLSFYPDYKKVLSWSTRQTLPPDKAFWTNEIGIAEEARTREGKGIDYVVYGRVIYKDITGREHVTGFAIDMVSYMPLAPQWDNKRYNYFN